MAVTLTGFAPSVTFAENTVNITPQLLDGDVVFTGDAAFTGGTLTLSGLLAEDRASVRNEGTAAGQIGLSGSSVTFGGAVIGSLAGGVGGTLTITFTAAATSAAVDALIQNLTYANGSNTPTATRTLSLNVTDASGANLARPGPSSFTENTAAGRPFAGVDVGYFSSPSFVDLDGDGDLDAVVGESDGALRVFTNTAAAGQPATFTENTAAGRPFAGVTFSDLPAPAFVDLDGDGDRDAVIGDNTGGLRVFTNTAAAGQPATFTENTAAGRPFAGVDVGYNSAPSFVDLDGDGDLDAVVGEEFGTLRIFTNTAAAGQPATFTEDRSAGRPFAGVSEPYLARPAFADLDGDGDMDAVVGKTDGTLVIFTNTAAAGQPASFTKNTAADRPFAGIDVGENSAPSFVDLDGDGDLDAVVGDLFGALRVFTNTPAAGASPTIAVNVTAQNDAPTLTGFGPSVTFAENTVNAAPQLLDADVTFGDAEGNFPGGTLTLSGLLAEDRVSIQNQGAAAGQIGFNGTTVTFGGVTIGTATGGSGATLTVTLNGAATSAAVDALIQSLTYANLSDTPTATRTLTLNVTDAAGGQLTNPASLQPAAVNPFAGLDVGDRATPSFGDVDGDGDLDLVSGDNNGGALTFFRNGTNGTSGAYTLDTANNPFAAFTTFGSFSSATLADVDGDGDIDAVVGADGGSNLTYLRNGTTGTSGAFVNVTGAANPFGSIVVERGVAAFADVDGDGDNDLLVGTAFSGLRYFVNGTNGTTGTFAEVTGAANPFNGLAATETSTAPTFGDVDGDGDNDLIVGTLGADSNGALLFFRNGTNGTSGAFAAPPTGQNEVAVVGQARRGDLADIDGDGDLDLVTGLQDGTFRYFTNAASGNRVITVNVTAQNDAPTLTGFGPSVTFLENTVNATPQLLDADVVFADAEGNFTGGTLVLSGLLAEDRASIQNQGTAAGQIGFTSGTGAVTFGGVQIGTAMGGSGSTLTVTLNGAATAAAVDALIQSLTYANVSNTPTAGRTLSLQITDAAGANLAASGIGVLTPLTGASNPFNGVQFGIGDATAIAFTDVDGDGDLDVVLGGEDGTNLRYFRNDNSATTFTELTGAANPFGTIQTSGTFAPPAFADTDGDGDEDLLVGLSDGTLNFYRNDAGAYVSVVGAGNPFNGVNVGPFAIPTFGDIDGDGDEDALIGNQDGTLATFRNENGSAAFTRLVGAADPFSGVDTGGSLPAFTDLDGDGDMDVVVGTFSGIQSFRNVGGVFTRITGAEDRFTAISGFVQPAFGDIDGDGDVDLLLGGAGPIQAYTNGPAITVNVTAQNDSPVNTVPVAQTTAEDTARVFSTANGNAIQVADVDSATLTITLTATNGTFTLSTTSGLMFLLGDGTADATATFSGSIAALNTALNGLSFTPTTNFSGAASLAINTGDPSGGSDADTVAITVTPVNDAPTLTGFGPSVTFLENTVNATPQLLDADVVFNEVDGNVGGGTLTLSGLLAEDRASIRNEGTAAGQIGFDGTAVTFGGVVIGTASGGAGGATFTVALNGAATVAAVDALIQNLTYANVSDTPTATRNLTLNVTDAAGGSLAQPGPSSFTENTAADRPFADANVGQHSAPSFVDLDGDGDLDAVIGANDGTLRIFTNTAAAGQPASFTEDTAAGRPFAGVDVGLFSAPSFVDLDGDGDLDAVVGELNGTLRVFTNTATAGQPASFTENTAAGRPFAGVTFAPLPAPTFVDLDGDGDRDAVVGDNTGTLRIFTNTAAAGQPASFTENTAAGRPFAGVDVGSNSAPSFVDLDGDGDLDAVVGEEFGTLRIFINTAAAGQPATLAEDTTAGRPFAGVDVSNLARPSFVDLDGDGDLDGVIGNTQGTLRVFTNTSILPTITVTVTPESDNTAPTLTGFGPSATFAENTVNATPQLLDADVVFDDAEGNVGMGSLTVSGLLAEDRVSVRNEGAGAGQIGFPGAGAVTFGGVLIGIASGGAGGTFTVIFNANATVAAVDALVQNLTYGNVSNAPTVTRTLTLNVVDAAGEGLAGGGQPITVTVTPQNDGPAASPDALSLLQRLTVTGSLTANDTDPDADTLTVTSVTGSGAAVAVAGATLVQGTYGDLTVNPDGTISYYANEETLIVNQVVTDVFTYTVSDPSGATASSTVTFTVTGSPEGDENVNRIIGDGTNNTLNGYGNDDQLNGAVGDDLVNGGDGNDLAQGGMGDDVVDGGLGDDTVAGGAGNDVLIGGDGTDQVIGGDGIDTASYATATAGVTVNLQLQGSAQATGGAGSDTLTQIENLTGSAFNDTLIGDAGVNVIRGGEGADFINGSLGDDVVYGGDGNDFVVGGQNNDLVYGELGDDTVAGGLGNDTVNGGLGQDVVNGNDGDDLIQGGQGDDQLFGDAGNDLVAGGLGADILDGGAGADIFLYSAAAQSTTGARDLIRNFVSGTDKVDLTGIRTGDPADSFTITSFGNLTLLTVDLGGDGTIDLQIGFEANATVLTTDVLF